MSLKGEQLETLRKLVDLAHKDSGFGDGSPLIGGQLFC
jgi:hypothetical protein